MPQASGSNDAPLPYNVTADPATRVAGRAGGLPERLALAGSVTPAIVFEGCFSHRRRDFSAGVR